MAKKPESEWIMDVLVSICARGGSKGIPRKAMRPFCGEPLIGRTIKQAQQLPYPYIVSTEDAEIADYARSLGAEVLDRPPELATDEASKWDVFRHIVRDSEPEYLVDLDICCPLRSVIDIQGCIVFLLHKQNYKTNDLVVTAYPAERNPYFNMVEGGDENGGWYVVGNGEYDQEIHRRQDAPEVYSLSPAVFAIHAPTLFIYKHWSSVGVDMNIYPIPRERAIDCDTELDFEFAEWLAKRQA